MENLITKGRILNQFSKDTGCMDDELPQTLNNVVQVNSFIHKIITFFLIGFTVFKNDIDFIRDVGNLCGDIIG